MHKKTCSKGQVICEEGKPSESIYIICKGEFEIRTSDSGVIINAAASSKLNQYEREQFLYHQAQMKSNNFKSL